MKRFSTAVLIFFAIFDTGCNVEDASEEAARQGQPCDKPGQVDGDLECVGGRWQFEATQTDNAGKLATVESTLTRNNQGNGAISLLGVYCGEGSVGQLEGTTFIKLFGGVFDNNRCDEMAAVACCK